MQFKIKYHNAQYINKSYLDDKKYDN